MPRDQKDLLLTDVERRLLLRDLAGFAALSDEALAAVASLGRRRELAPGTTIVHAGGMRASALMLLAGDLQLVRMGRSWPYPSERRVLDVLWLARDSMPLEVTTRDGALVLEFPRDGLEEVLEEHFSIWLASARTLAGWLLPASPPADAPVINRRRHRGHGPLTERLEALQQALPFARGYVDALLQLAEEATEVHYDAGTVLWRPGDPARDILVPIDGELRGALADDPCGLGSLELLAERPRVTRVETLKPLVALRLGREMLLDLFEDHHALARDLLAVLAAAVVQSLDAAADREA
jgi:hypothetical protein